MPSNLRAALTLLPRRRCPALPSSVLTDPVTVSRRHLASYQRVCGFPISDTLPGTYPHVLAFPLAMRLMTASGFPFPVVGLVHVSQQITVHGPLDFQDLDLSVRTEHLRPHARGQQFDVVATASSFGRPIWTGISTYLRISSPSSSSPSSLDFTPAASWQVPLRTGTDYAAVSGDHNPIHTSRLGARLFGFPRPIAHGMWTAARCLAALGPRLPFAYRASFAFKRPILLPARVDFGATPVDLGWEFRVGSHLAGTVTAI